MNARLLLLTLTALSLAACAPRDPSGPTGPRSPSIDFPDLLPLQDLYSLQSFSGMADKGGMIITDSTVLRAVWATVFANYAVGQKPMLPAIDFKQNVVLVASAGQTPTQLIWFRITKVRERPGHLAVLVESAWPGCGGVPVVTNPVHIVMVPRVSSQAVFEFVDYTEPCP